MRLSPLGPGGGDGPAAAGSGDGGSRDGGGGGGDGGVWMGPLQGESSASAFGSAVAQAGGGFSFPVTPPTHEEEEVHEAHAERVFSTWASSHSRTAEEAPELALGGASDDEGAPARLGSWEVGFPAAVGGWRLRPGCHALQSVAKPFARFVWDARRMAWPALKGHECMH